MKKEEYIAKAEAVHGKGTYDYSKLPDEIICKSGSQYKIPIICPIHGEFLQIPSSHLHGHGCCKCGFLKSTKAMHKSRKGYTDKFQLKRKKTSQQELEELLKDKPWKLDQYVDSINSKGHCETHNVELKLNKFSIQKGKCPCINCAKEFGRVGESTFEKIKKILDFYNWEAEIPNKLKNTTLIKSKCKKHDTMFNFSAKDFPESGGCPICMNRNQKYNNRYNDKYLNNLIENLYHGKLKFVSRLKDKNIIKCIITKWNVERKFSFSKNFKEGNTNIYLVYNTKTFIAKCKIDFNSQLDYSKTKYIDGNHDIIYVCPIHGKVTQKANVHLFSGAKCSKCSKGVMTTEEFIKRAKEIHN